ncbi:4-hydroxy-tetrahydrodipicolinate synthase [Hondaea fermentalgiana]|uniref:4-hydroxy-tetrahydrodipicolinate synthase n=1 Tax=Hondaea fermentalgiana TaxID=2315210 RepID=A0A2R5H237_9STRA|nr:4-hydroxy-tetrahydrodipicolinate synthase [Hondaea fermentalgiana]|eukprot:GBG34901.1 4-hydroxy-tetrahydrodipicolinate synthase [Hondaea fermentalgiana]
MARLELAGVFPALVTPFSADGKEVDYEALEKLLDAQIAGGVAGVVPIGTTGESPTLTAEEREKIIAMCVEKCAGKCLVIAGTGSNNTEGTVAATKKAKEAGVDAVLIVNPYYSKPSQEGLFQHVKAVNEVGVPIVLYNIPGRTGIALTAATVARMYKELDNVCAIKEATGSLDMASEIRSLCDITVLSGDDSLTLPLMSVGGKGVVSVLSNLAPEKVVSMVKAAADGDFAGAAKQHIELFPVFKGMFCETNPVPCKYAMSLAGMCDASVRLPLAPLAAESKAKVEAMCEAAGLASSPNGAKKAKQ